MNTAEQSPSEFLADTDPILGQIIRITPFPDHTNAEDVFEDLCSCILGMRIHYAGQMQLFATSA